MNQSLLAIAKLRLPGLLTTGLVETGRAQLITEFAALPVRIEADGAALTAQAKIGEVGMSAEARAYLHIAARDYAYALVQREDGLWMSTGPINAVRQAAELAEFCRIARQMADGAGWLERDPIARAFWASQALTEETAR